MLKQFPFFSALRLFPLVKYVLSLIFDCDFFSSKFVYFFSVIIKNINGELHLVICVIHLYHCYIDII